MTTVGINPFQVKGRQFYKIFLTFSQMLDLLREQEALQVWDKWQCTCLPVTLRPVLTSDLG